MAEPAAPAPDAPESVRARIFGLTWLSYFSYYFSRKPVSATKPTLVSDFGLSKAELNWIDTTYNVAYAVGQVTNGFLVDRIGPRRWVSLGMLVSAAVVIAFQLVHTVTGWLVGTYMILWGLNGLAQSTGWPGNSKAMASWYSTRRRGEVMGWWSTCYQAGGLVATLFAAELIKQFGWRGAYVGPAIWVAVVALAFYLFVRDRPSDLGYRDPDTVAMSAEERRRILRVEWPRLLRTPMIWVLGASYFCCKLIRYAFLFWLPLYIHEAHGYDNIDSLQLSLPFEAGGIVCVVLAGYVADRVFVKRRVFTAFLFLCGLVASLFLYSEIAGHAWWAHVIGLTLIGGTLFAADSLICGAVAQDLGGPHAAALASGLVNGIGSIGQVLQGFLLVYIERAYGWDAVFTMFSILAGLGALALIPYLRVGPVTSAPPAPRG